MSRWNLTHGPARRATAAHARWIERITPLGDLDGDGFAEIAVLHPRQDRSGYEWELFDLAFGAKSWVSIVSGSRVERR